ncbi:MAG TPA: sulfide/dihydroorotate dehydrogenase-like FAD/NAD-binding protein [Candidatus Atribacteria bacterium]|nr:sulfide/dihydroorotate dehydrogenase-like FAD/NAD-binding protein [Candidatus Atribacteria bacterium]HPT78331.1 sulfide/dihydroorotate dehydrogenase-like FAD/NAD-binding protein [Candidatus Atribacteria bacterium]
MYKIIEKRTLAPGVHFMRVDAPLVARSAMPGQFIILRVLEEGERIPLTIADYDRTEGWVTIIFQEVGHTTGLLAELGIGDHILDFAGPLGRASELDRYSRVLCIGGGVGTAPLYPQIKHMHEAGTEVDVILGARSRDYILLADEIRRCCSRLYIATDDGSLGHKGFVTDLLKELVSGGERYDHVIAIGPLVMMKAVSALTREFMIPTTVSMNPIMVDGTGMCGGCRVTVGGKTRYACVDGPDFDGHLVDFDEAMRRQQMYRQEEKESHICRLPGMGGQVR